MRQLPERGIKLLPDAVSAMMPRPAQIQGQLDEGIKAHDVHGKQGRERGADPCVCVHGSSCLGSDSDAFDVRGHPVRGSGLVPLQQGQRLLAHGLHRAAILAPDNQPGG